MIAIVGGFGAALLWATSTLSTSRSSRIIPPASVLAWVMLIGVVITFPFAAIGGIPSELDREALTWLLVSGVANLIGLLLNYGALRIGKVGIVAPITSAQGATAAAIAVVAGEHIAAGAGATMMLIALGVVLASLAGGRTEGPEHEDHHRRAVAMAVAASVLFGLGLYAVGRLSGDLPVEWVLFPPRLIGTLAVTLPLALTRRLRFDRRAAPFIAVSGVGEIAGLALFTIGARVSIGVTAIVASQFAALAALAAYLLFGERLARVQVAGVAAIVVGVGVLTALQV